MWGRSSIGEAGAMWIKVSITGHDAGVGLPDIDEIREVGEATHFYNKEKIILYFYCILSLQFTT